MLKRGQACIDAFLSLCRPLESSLSTGSARLTNGAFSPAGGGNECTNARLAPWWGQKKMAVRGMMAPLLV